MAIIKSCTKFLLFISIVLAVGQISIAGETLGFRFVQGVKNGAVWARDKALASPALSQVPIPDFLKDVLPKKEKEKEKEMIKKSKRVSEVEGELSSADRDQVLQLLRN